MDDAQDFTLFQETLTREEVKTKIETMLQKDKEVSNFYSLSDQALYIFASKEDKENHLPEFVLRLGSKPKIKPNKLPSFGNPYTPLKGLRVAIDPGHIGGAFSKLEEKYIHMKPKEEQGIYEEIEFSEGDLAVLTAKKLARKLKALGAEVLLTKTQPGSPVYKKDYSKWLEEDFDDAVSFLVTRQDNPTIQEKERLYWKTIASESEVFRSTYNFLDVERRAELINAFKPHVTVTCHYNLGGIYDSKGYTPGVTDDYTLFFVPGAFKRGSLKNEKFKNSSLKSERARYEFVRLLLTDDIEQSVLLAKIAREHAKSILDLPSGDHCNYLKVLCLKNDEGIYHRNLVLTRMVHSPLLYCEPFCQDNYAQAKILSETPEIKVDQVVELYLRSILDWVDYNSQKRD